MPMPVCLCIRVRVHKLSCVFVCTSPNFFWLFERSGSVCVLNWNTNQYLSFNTTHSNIWYVLPAIDLRWIIWYFNWYKSGRTVWHVHKIGSQIFLFALILTPIYSLHLTLEMIDGDPITCVDLFSAQNCLFNYTPSIYSVWVFRCRFSFVPYFLVCLELFPPVVVVVVTASFTALSATRQKRATNTLNNSLWQLSRFSIVYTLFLPCFFSRRISFAFAMFTHYSIICLCCFRRLSRLMWSLQ